MRPVSTKFRLAKAGGEWNRLYAMAKRAGLSPHKGDFAFPIVVAERAGRVIGFLPTITSPDAVIAGPFVAEERNPILFMRLLESYENVLRAAGVKAYLCPVESKYVEQMTRIGFTPQLTNPAGMVAMRRNLQ